MVTEERGEGQSNREAQFDSYTDGMRLLSAGDFEGAIAAFGKAIAVDPDSAFAATPYRRRADAYRQLGKEEEAEADAKAADEIRGFSSTPIEQTAAEGARQREAASEASRLSKVAEEYRARQLETVGRYRSGGNGEVPQWRAIIVGGIGGVVAGVIIGLVIVAAGVTLYEWENNLALRVATVLGPLFIAGAIAGAEVRGNEVKNGPAAGIAMVVAFFLFLAVATSGGLDIIAFVLFLVFGAALGALGGAVGGSLRTLIRP